MNDQETFTRGQMLAEVERRVERALMARDDISATSQTPLERALCFIETLTEDPLLLADDIEMTLDDVQGHARIELASIRKQMSATPADHVVGSDKHLLRAANALLNTLWQLTYSGSRSFEENWEEMDRRYPQARWLHDELKAARAASAEVDG